jgi:hypothetical protein
VGLLAGSVEQEHNQPLLLVLDDFEQNIPTANIEDGSLRMMAQSLRILLTEEVIANSTPQIAANKDTMHAVRGNSLSIYRL